MPYTHPPRRLPSILLVLTDDQGWGDLSYTGNTNLSTPRIDALARQGAILDRFFVQPLCAPTRAEILTGRYFPRTGCHGVTRSQERINLDETTIAQVLKQAGYATGCFGKWHSGSAYPYHPNGRGFDEFFGFCCGHWSDYYQGTVERNGVEEKFPGYLPDTCTEEALRFMKRHADRPFFCYVPLNIPHSPFQVPDELWNRFKDRDLRLRGTEAHRERLDATRAALAMCENIDWNVGRLVDQVAELGLAGNTIIIYLSDNGPNGHRWNGGMRGIKGSTEEGGVRSPCSITCPGVISPGTVIRQISGAIDLLPTLADFAGLHTLPTRPLDGVSLRPLLEGTADQWPERAIFAQSHDGRYTSIRTQRYRAGGHTDGLFDMDQDPGQTRDLSADLSNLRTELQRRIDAFRAEVLPSAEPPARPVPLGYRTFPTTHLRPEDGNPVGEVKWSSMYPNCSYFTNWTRPSDTIYWEVVVETAGVYQAVLMYTCRPQDVGAYITISVAGQSAGAKVTEAFDPAVRDAFDRVPREESYGKDFHPLPLGHLKLAAGRQRIELRASHIPAERAVDVGSVRMTLLP